MRLTTADLAALIGLYLWPFFRIGALLMAAPVLGARLVPVRVRLGLALALTAVVAPLAGPVPALDPLTLPGLFVTVQQVLVGVAMGFALQLVFGAFVHGGQVVAMQMGLGFASMVDPQHGVQVPVVSQFYVILVTLLFFALDGHLALVEVLVESFRAIPVSPHGLAIAGWWDLVAWTSVLFAGALRIALPAVAALLFVNLALGVMARAAPQLNIFAVGFPMSLLLGFVAMLLTLPGLEEHVTRLLAQAFDHVRDLPAGGR